ncbi:MAG: hypothetical protein ACXWDN_17890 [Limisphaerales bacterium]
MAYEVNCEPGEIVEADIQLNLSKKARPFFFAITNKAVYIPRIKLVAISDPFYFQRIPVDQVRQISVKRIRPFALWVLAALMVVVGLLTTFWMMQPVLTDVPGKHRISGWPISVFICGFIVPFAARGRAALEVRFNGGRYRWKPPLVVDKPSKQRVTETFDTIIAASKNVGFPIADTRPIAKQVSRP